MVIEELGTGADLSSNLVRQLIYCLLVTDGSLLRAARLHFAASFTSRIAQVHLMVNLRSTCSFWSIDSFAGVASARLLLAIDCSRSSLLSRLLPNGARVSHRAGSSSGHSSRLPGICSPARSLAFVGLAHLTSLATIQRRRASEGSVAPNWPRRSEIKVNLAATFGLRRRIFVAVVHFI